MLEEKKREENKTAIFYMIQSATVRTLMFEIRSSVKMNLFLYKIFHPWVAC